MTSGRTTAWALAGAMLGVLTLTFALACSVIFRNFVGATEVPAELRHRLLEDVELGATLTLQDRSVFASRVHVARVLP